MPGSYGKTTDIVKQKIAKSAQIHDLPIPDGIWGDARRDQVHDTYRDIFRNHDVLARGWISAIRDDEPIEPDFGTGAAVQRVLAACARSAADGRRVCLDEIAG